MMHAARRGPRPIFCAPVARVCAAALLVLFAAAPAIAAETQKENETPEKATRLEPLEVAGERIEPLTAPSSSRQRHDMTRIPAAASLVGRSEWRNTASATVKDMLDFTAGVFVQPKWGGDSRLSIRGSGLSRYYHLRGINLYQDGMPLNSADGSSDFQWIDPTAYRHVEVYRGASGLRYGAGSLGGAINFVTTTGSSVSRPELRADVGSHGWRRLYASGGFSKSGNDGFITGSAQRQDGFRAHSQGEVQRINANYGHTLGERAETRFYLAGLRSRQRLPGSVSREQALEQPQRAAGVNVIDDWQHNLDSGRIGNRTVIATDSGRLELGGWLSAGRLDHPIYEYLDHDRRDHGLFARAERNLILSGLDNRLVVGVNWSSGRVQAQQFENIGGFKGRQTSHVRNHADNLTLYAENRLHITPDWALTAGLQYLRASRTSTDRLNGHEHPAKKHYDIVNPSLGLLWQPAEDVQLYAGLSRSGEAPTWDDLQFDSLVALDRLRHQRATTLEAGTRGQTARLAWDISVYRARLSNEFQCVSTAWNICNATTNLDDTTHQGVEASARWTVLDNPFGPPGSISLNTAWTFNDFRFGNDPDWHNNRIPGVPRHYVRTGLEYRQADGFYLGAGAEWVPQAFYVDNANSLKTKAYALISARAGWDSGFFSIFFEGRNLANKKYIASASITDTAAADAALFEPGSGRSINVGLQLRF